jgi:hypothetical protein
MASLFRFTFVAFSILFIQGQAFAASIPRYDIKLELSEDHRGLSGTLILNYKNTLSRALKRLPLLCYPERFRKQHPQLTDRNFHRFYPKRHNPGALELRLQETKAGSTSLSLEELSVLDPKSEVRAPSPWPAGYLRAVRFDPPLKASAKVRIVLSFELTIPERYGAFGRLGKNLILEGGITPLLPGLSEEGLFDFQAPPRRASFQIRGLAKGGQTLLINGHEHSNGAVARFTGRSFSLVHAEEKIFDRKASSEDPRIRVYGRDEDRAERLGAAAIRVLEAFYKKIYPGKVRPFVEHIVFVEAPLRDRLMHVRGNVIFYSDRLYHVAFLLESFHDRELARGILEHLFLSSALSRKERSDDWWLATGLSFHLRDQVPISKQGFVNSKRLGGFLDFFSFIPTVDQILRAPRFANSDLFFGQLLDPLDSVRDGFQRYPAPRARGRLIIHKVLERTGLDSLPALVKKILKPARSRIRPGHRFRQIVSRRLKGKDNPKDWDKFFEVWLGPIPKEQLSIKRVQIEDGRTRVTISRQCNDDRIAEIGDPVKVVYRHGSTTLEKRWDGRGQEVTLDFPGDSYFIDIRIDPERGNPDAFRGDNSWPNSLKILLNRFSFSPDLNGGNNTSGALGITILPYRRYDHPITLDTFYERDTRGLKLGYSYGFGTQLDARTFGIQIGGQLNFERVDVGVISIEQSRLIRGRDKLADVNFPAQDGTIISATVRASFDTRRARRSPASGFSFGTNIEISKDDFGSDFNYQLAAAQGTALWSIIRGHTLAFRGQLSYITGSDIPVQRLPDIGGQRAVRGIQDGDFIGQTAFVFRSEYRHILLTELELGALTLAYWRRLEGVVFYEMGEVGRHLSDVFADLGQWKSGVGYGIRIHADIFGVRSTVLRLDVAYRLDSSEDRKALFYFGVNQSF